MYFDTVSRQVSLLPFPITSKLSYLLYCTFSFTYFAQQLVSRSYLFVLKVLLSVCKTEDVTERMFAVQQSGHDL